MYTTLIVVAVVLIGAALIVRANIQSFTVFEFERGLRFHLGKFTGVVEPGRYRLWVGRGHIRKVDLRRRILAVPGQEVLSSDGVALKASVVATYRIADPVKAVLEVTDVEPAMHTVIQLALRSLVSASPAEDLLERRGSIGAQLFAATSESALAIGIELVAIDLKDLTLPGDLKKVFSQVVRAKQEGLAALERARGETAALRSLANAARAIAGNPQLLQLRWLQVLGERSGNTVVLGVPSGPIPVGTQGASGEIVGETDGE